MWRMIVLFHVITGTISSPFDDSLNLPWELFKTNYNKTYVEDEEGARRMIFEENVEFIVKHNLEADLGVHGYRLKINKYADMTQEEYVSLMTAEIITPTVTVDAETIEDMNAGYEAPNTIDWNKRGYVTRVKDQGYCGACWSFTAVGLLEALHKKQTGQLIALSEQNLIDCSRQYGTHGCTGGHPYFALEYVKANRGIDTERSYPYRERETHTCQFRRTQIGANCSVSSLMKSMTEDTMKAVVARVGPIAVNIDASSPRFKYYRSGVYDDTTCSKNRPNHSVLIVGYGTTGGKDYWLIKNSHGKDWGMHGYMMMARNKNVCGVGNEMTFAQ